MKKGLFFCCLLGIVLITKIQAQKPEQLNHFIEEVLKKVPQVPGLSLVLVNKDSILLAKGYGYADVEKKLNSTQHIAYYIASCTKSFTALLAASLAEKGQLDLNKPLTDFAPYKNLKNKSLFEQANIFDLLTHQSRLENDWLTIPLAYSGLYSRQSILNILENYTVVRQEGKKFDYSNDGYYLFSILLQEEFGLDWRELLREQIFTPLGMDNTSAYVSAVERQGVAMPYIGVLASQPERSNLAKTDVTMHAAGGIMSTAHDLGLWLRCQLNSGHIGGLQIISRPCLTSTHQTYIADDHKYSPVFKGTGYGLGWRTGHYKKYPLIYHFGGYPGFFSHISFLPEQNLGIALIVNHTDGNVIGNRIAEYAYDLYLGDTAALVQQERYLHHKLPELIRSAQAAERKSKEKLAKRQWMLSQPQVAYCGQYNHSDLGTIEVKQMNDKLLFTFGNMASVATPYPEVDHMRLELIPGSGTVVQFQAKNGQVNALKYKSLVFYKQ